MAEKVFTDVPAPALDSLVGGDHGSPFDVLGAHALGKSKIVIRALRPNAETLYFCDEANGKLLPMQKRRPEGLFEIVVNGAVDALRYHFEAVTYRGKKETFADPYAFQLKIEELDLYLFREGKHLNAFEFLGAHITEIDGVAGTRFAVWAPNAYSVSVIGDFNEWDGRAHLMQAYADSGIWQLFIPNLEEGAIYRYRIRSHNQGYSADKTDPYGFYAERRPANASIVKSIDGYAWADSAWMNERGKNQALDRPMSTYEVHLGSWRRKADGAFYTYRELADELVAYVRDLGYTHIELMPIAEHPLDASWGYQVTGYFAPTSRYGTPQDFMYFVDVCHQNNIGVILDWVPAHFPKDGHALSYFDGTHLYEHADPRRGEHPDWGTLIFNYGRNEVRSFLISNALFWLKHYHIDGLRVDAVSSMLYLDFSRKSGEWLPNEFGGNENLDAVSFLREVNTVVHSDAPGAVVIAEESTAWAMVSRPVYIGGLGFTYKWNMGWMHDTLEYIKKDPVYRRYHHNKMTFSLLYAFNENFVLALSHDEVVHGKGSLIDKAAGDWWQKFATLRLLVGYQYTHPGKKLLFMGQEFGQWREWSETRGLDWHLLDMPTHQGAQAWMRDLNHLYKAQPAFWQRDFDDQGFRWINADDADQSVFSYIRYAQDREDFLVIVCNFTPVPYHHYRIGVPASGTYSELLNSDAKVYGGGDIGNGGSVNSEAIPSHALDHSLALTVPPLAMVILKLKR